MRSPVIHLIRYSCCAAVGGAICGGLTALYLSSDDFVDPLSVWLLLTALLAPVVAIGVVLLRAVIGVAVADTRRADRLVAVLVAGAAVGGALGLLFAKSVYEFMNPIGYSNRSYNLGWWHLALMSSGAWAFVALGWLARRRRRGWLLLPVGWVAAYSLCGVGWYAALK